MDSLHSPNPSAKPIRQIPTPEEVAATQQIWTDFFKANSTVKINLRQPTPEEEEARNRGIDALPRPPQWYYPHWPMSDPTQLYELFTTLSDEEIKAKVDLQFERFVKTSYQEELKSAGSVDKLEGIKQKDSKRREDWRVAWCQQRGIDPYPTETHAG